MPKPNKYRQKMDRYLESQGLLNYQTKGLSQQEISKRYASAGVNVQGNWFDENYKNNRKEAPPQPAPRVTQPSAPAFTANNQPPAWLPQSSPNTPTYRPNPQQPTAPVDPRRPEDIPTWTLFPEPIPGGERHYIKWGPLKGFSREEVIDWFNWKSYGRRSIFNNDR